MAVVIKSNSIASASLGNVNGLGSLQDFRFLVDFENEETVIKENGVITKETIADSIIFTRSSIANYTKKGVEKTAGINEPRFHTMYNGDTGLLIEPTRTNLLSNPKAPITQTVSVNSAGASAGVVLSMEGTGSVTMSGDIKDISGALATQGNPIGAILVNPGSGTSSITVTVTGNVTRFQLERAEASRGGVFVSTFIDGTRAAETLELSSLLTSKLSPEFSIIMAFTKYDVLGNLNAARNVLGISDTVLPKGGVFVALGADSSVIAGSIVKKSSSSVSESLNFGISKIDKRNTVVVSHDLTNTKLAINGLSKVSVVGHDLGNPNRFEIGAKNVFNPQEGQIGGIIRKIAFFNRKLTDNEIIAASKMLL